jgi:hypothetical protein
MDINPDDKNHELSLCLGNIFLEHKNANIGIQFDLLKYWAFYSIDKQTWDQRLNFVNLNMYWSPLKIRNIIFDSRLRFLLALVLNDKKKCHSYNFQIIGSEIGYQNISGNHKFYFNLNVDITIPVVAIEELVYGSMYAAASDARATNEEYEKQINGSGGYIPKEPKEPKNPFINEENRD